MENFSKNSEVDKGSASEFQNFEKIYKILFDNISDVIYALDQDFKVILISPSVENILGYKPEELIGRSFPDLNILCPEYLNKAFENLMTVFSGKQVMSAEYEFYAKDGNRKYGEVTGSPLFQEEKVIGVLSVARDISYRKLMESEVLRNETKYRQIFENSLEGIFQTTPEGRFITINPALAMIYGYDSPKQMIEGITDIGHEIYVNPQDREKVIRLIQEQGYAYNVELQFRKRDGSSIWAILNSHAVYDNEGKVLLYEGTILDITDRKIAEEALWKTQSRLQLMSDILEKSSQAFAVGYPDGRIGFINNAYCNLLGYTSDDLRQINWNIDLTPPEYRKEEARHLDLLLKTGKAVHYEKEYIRKDGTRVPVELTVDSVFDENDQLLNYCAFVNDLTHRRQMEKTIRDSELQMRQIIESSPIGIRIALDGKYAYANNSFIKIFGYDSFDKIAGKPIEDFYPPEFKNLVRQMNQDCISGRPLPIHYDGKGLKNDGSQFDISVWLTRIEYQGGPASLAFIVDTSAEKKLEAQLLHAQKMEAIGTLAGGVAHDFNNILTTIIGNAEMSLMQIHKDHPFYDAFSEIKKAGETAASLTRQLLTLGRKQTTQTELIDLNQLIRKTEKMLRRLIKEHIIIQIKNAPDLRQIMADPTHLEQVLLNLSINASDAMPLGGCLTFETTNIKLEGDYFIRRGVDAKPGDYVRLKVSDTGHGIEKQVQYRIFEPFFSTKERGKGTGLGLATVYGIVKQTEGYIWVESEPGKGTIFTIDWPAGMTEKKPAHDEEKTIDQAIDKGNETILLVEDEDSLRNFVFNILKKYGYTVLMAPNGKQALELIQRYSGKIDLILTDLIMPELGGKEFSQRLQKQGIKTNILFMSGYPGEEISHFEEIKQADIFIQKPFSPKELVVKIRNILDKE